jgi:hypothetical protein
MMRLDSPDLAAAVARLERQLRTVKLVLGAVLMVIGGLSLTAWIAPQGDTMTAKQFMILDADGIPRGMFGVLADQASIGMMYTDPSGNTRLEMSVDPFGRPRLALMDELGRVRSEIAMRDDGSPTIVLTDSSESQRIALSTSNAGAGQLTLFGDKFVNESGDTVSVQRAMFGTVSNGEPAIVFSDASDTTRASLNMSADGAAQWRFFGPDGTTERAVLGVYADGMPILRLADSTGTASFFRHGGMLADTMVVAQQ